MINQKVTMMGILDPRRYILFLISFSALLTSCGGDSEVKPIAQTEVTSSAEDFTSINEAIKESPNNPDLYLRRARLFKQNQQLKDAYSDVGRALKIDSLLPAAHHEMGLLYYMDGQMGEAKFAFEGALSLDSKYIPSMLQLAEIYLVLKNYNKSMTEINNVLKIDQQVGQAYFLKGLIYKEQKNMELAKSSFQTAIEMNPQNVEAFNLLGMIYAEEDDGLSMTYYNTVLDIDSAHKEALYNRAFFLQDQGYVQDALEAYDLLLKFHPGTAVAYYNKGYVYFGYLNDVAQAIDAFTEAIRFNPQFVKAYFNRAVALEEKGKKSDAINDYKKVVELDPDHDAALAALNRLGAK
jgi:tetratricopeptide (TPR) repeat protein